MITLRQTINYGKKYAYSSSMGIGLGILVHLSYTILGFGLIIKNMPYLLDVLRIVGALYLIFLGIGGLLTKSSSIELSKEKVNTYSLKKSFIIGFFCNLLNPKATLFFLSIFTAIVSIKTPYYIQSLYGLYCILANIFWYMFIANILSRKKNMKLYNKYKSAIEITIGLVLILLGLKLIILPL
jgi:threonine/homoserine/homoserine lactone efflux protein